jgi:hypothetical protein
MKLCEQLYRQFERIVQDCVRTNQFFVTYNDLNNRETLKKVVYIELVQFMMNEHFVDCAPYILGHYNVGVFEQAWKVFGKMLREGKPPFEAINTIAFQIVVRRLKDHLEGEFSMFGKRSSKLIDSEIKYLLRLKV